MVVLDFFFSDTTGSPAAFAVCTHPCGWGDIGGRLACCSTRQAYIFHTKGARNISPSALSPAAPAGRGRCPLLTPFPPPPPSPPTAPFLLTQQEQAVCRFISQPLLLQLLLYFFVGFSLRFLIDTLILRFAVAQTPHSRCLGWMSNPGLYRFLVFTRGKGGRGGGEGGEGRRQVFISVRPCDGLLSSSLPPPRLAHIKWSLAAF